MERVRVFIIGGRIDHYARLSPGHNASEHSSVAWKAQIITSVARKARIEYCPASWDKALPGKLASGQLVSSNATAANTFLFAK